MQGKVITMKYVHEIMICAVACGIVLMIAPERSEGTKRCVRLAVSLVMLCAIIRPIANIAEDIPDVLEYADRMIPDEDRDDGSTEDVVVSAICTAAEKAAGEYFSVPDEDFSVTLSLVGEGGSLAISGAEVSVTGEGAELPARSVERYFSEILGCEVSVYGCEK